MVESVEEFEAQFIQADALPDAGPVAGAEPEVDAEPKEITEGDAGETGEAEKAKAPSGSARLKTKLEAERRANADLQARLAQYEAGNVQQDPNAPSLDQFDGDIGAYTKAQVQYELKQERQAEQSKQAATAVQKRMAEFAAKTPDFFDVIEDADVVMNQAMVEAVQIWDSGPAIAYELAKNPEIAERLAGLPPIQVIRELAKLEAQIEARSPTPTSSAKAKASTAPKPINPVSATGGAAAFDPREKKEMTFQEYSNWRNSGGK